MDSLPADSAWRPNPLYNRVIFVLSLLGLMVASALLYWHTHPHPVVDMPCGASGGCEAVAESPYIFFPLGSGIPVALYGVIGYAVIGAISFVRTLLTDRRHDDHVQLSIGLSAIIGTLFALWLTSEEIFTIHAICRWCMTSQFLILSIAFTSLVERRNARERRSRPA